MTSSKKVLSVFSLVMINVIAVDSLRTLPIGAKLGLPLIVYYLIAAITFLIPVALVAAELATAYPNTGGIYVWVREAFGRRAGFITIWLQWIYNVVWYPTIMAFIAATSSYLFNADLATNKLYILSCSLSLFWIFTLLNCFGMRLSSLVSTIGALFGTLLPMLCIIILGALALINGQALAVDLSGSWLPNRETFSNLSLFSVILFGLLGMEMSATHAEEVNNPQRDYPKAIFISVILIFLTLVLSSLAIVMVIPNQQLNIVSGLVEAFAVFFSYYNLNGLTAVIALFIILGGLSGVSAWIIGPTKGLLVAAYDGSLPQSLAQVNKYNAPVRILVIQGVIFSILCSVFTLFDSISTAYLLLSDLCAQMALLVYVFMFAAAIKLRYIAPAQPRAYCIPGGKPGIWIVASIGILCCLSAMIIGFVPPSDISFKSTLFFEAFLIGGLLLFVAIPWLCARKN